MSQFYLPSTSTITTSTSIHSPTFSSDEDEEDTLPYPPDLPRSDFLAQQFNPQTYLSSLRNRHQTLEDLRSDLRRRSQLVNQELLELVNGNYEEFLGLGEGLRGGGEKVKGVRFGVLGFGREVEGVRKVVGNALGEVEGLLGEKERVRGESGVGRGLLEVHKRLGELEESLGITEKEDDAEPDDDDDELETSTTNIQPTAVRRLQRHTRQYILLTRMVERIGPSHPFLQAQQLRLRELRKTLLLDLAAALRQAKAAREPDAILGVVRMYGDLRAEGESVRVLKGG